jgi:hypothetical protein
MPKARPWLDPVEPVPSFAREMRNLRLRAGDPSLQQLARAMACSHSTVSAYLNGRRLPPPRQLESFVLACQGNAEDWLERLEAVREQLDSLPARETQRVTTADAERELVLGSVPDPSEMTLLQTFHDVARALRDCLARDADGRPTGWPRDLRELPGEATAISTAYGIRAMLLLEDGLAADLVPVAAGLRKMAVPAGGYAGYEQAQPRPEMTAVVLNALRRIAVTDSLDDHIAQMERDLGDFEKFRPLILTTMLETSLLLKPATELVETLVDSLLAARRAYGDRLLWPQKAEPSLVDPSPSVAHTARAVRVLADAQAVRPSSEVREALEQAVAWLVEQRELHNAYEVIERPFTGRPEIVHVRHFTAAWVVKALVSAGVPTAHAAVSNAVAEIWSSYGDAAALWVWDNGDLPTWMTFDAIEALRLANLALPAQPAWQRH